MSSISTSSTNVFRSMKLMMLGTTIIATVEGIEADINVGDGSEKSRVVNMYDMRKETFHQDLLKHVFHGEIGECVDMMKRYTSAAASLGPADVTELKQHLRNILKPIANENEEDLSVLLAQDFLSTPGQHNGETALHLAAAANQQQQQRKDKKKKKTKETSDEYASMVDFLINYPKPSSSEKDVTFTTEQGTKCAPDHYQSWDVKRLPSGMNPNLRAVGPQSQSFPPLLWYVHSAQADNVQRIMSSQVTNPNLIVYADQPSSAADEAISFLSGKKIPSFQHLSDSYGDDLHQLNVEQFLGVLQRYIDLYYSEAGLETGFDVAEKIYQSFAGSVGQGSKSSEAQQQLEQAKKTYELLNGYPSCGAGYEALKQKFTSAVNMMFNSRISREAMWANRAPGVVDEFFSLFPPPRGDVKGGGPIAKLENKMREVLKNAAAKILKDEL